MYVPCNVATSNRNRVYSVLPKATVAAVSIQLAGAEALVETLTSET
jgi:hypothetical protein